MKLNPQVNVTLIVFPTNYEKENIEKDNRLQDNRAKCKQIVYRFCNLRIGNVLFGLSSIIKNSTRELADSMFVSD